MAVNLYAISELVWRQVTTDNDESKLTLEEVDLAVKLEYGWQMLQMNWRERRENGEYFIPSYLSREDDLNIKDNEASIKDLKILKALPSEMWLQQVGVGCSCDYVKTTINQAQLMCDDESLPDGTRTYYVVGEKIKFPKGAHADIVPIIYASDGSDLDSLVVSVDEAIGALVRERVLASYLGKITPEDVTNNSNSNQ